MLPYEDRPVVNPNDPLFQDPGNGGGPITDRVLTGFIKIVAGVRCYDYVHVLRNYFLDIQPVSSQQCSDAARIIVYKVKYDQGVAPLTTRLRWLSAALTRYNRGTVTGDVYAFPDWAPVECPAKAKPVLKRVSAGKPSVFPAAMIGFVSIVLALGLMGWRR